MEGVVMGEHSKHYEHCDDVAFLGCECDPGCDDCDGGVSRDYYAGMTEGRRQEREHIIRLLDNEWFRDAREFLLSEHYDRETSVDKLHCEPHGWWLEEGELCPVCEGIDIERKRWVRVARERIIDLDSCAKDDDCSTLVRGVLLVVGDALDEVKETE